MKLDASKHNPPQPYLSMTSPDQPSHKARPVVAGETLAFPCWGFASRCKPPQWLLIMDGYNSTDELLAVGYTHYCEVEPPEAPAETPSPSRPANEGGAAASDLNDPRRVPVESAPATAHAIPPPATGDWPNDAGRVVDSAGNAIESATTEPPAKQGETPEYQPVAPGDFGAASWSELRDTLHSLRESLHEAKTELAGIKAAANCDLPGNEDCETVVRAMYHENRDLRARVAQLEQRILDDNKAYGCELRDPSGTIWEHAANLEKRLAQLEAKGGGPTS